MSFTSAPRDAALVPGEYLLTQADFRQIAAILHDDAGISLSETKAALVYARLAKRLRALGLGSFRDYCALVGQSHAVDERQKLVAALTTNVTKFFRESHHFDHMRKVSLPPLLERARKGEQIRIWSAGCSNGQEAYSAAMVILSMMPNVLDHDVKILASDIDPNMIAEGRHAVYSDSAVEDVPNDLKNRFLQKTRDGSETRWQVGDDARELVSFRELNLFAQWPMKKPFNIIFCRNVAIYFDKDKQAQLWGRFAQSLLPAGWLYIGHSERIAGPAASVFTNDGITTWCRTGGTIR